MLEHQWSRLGEYGRTSSSWGPEWVDAAFSSDNVLRLTPERTASLHAELHEIVERYKHADADADDTDSATVMVLMHGFPTQM